VRKGYILALIGMSIVQNKLIVKSVRSIQPRQIHVTKLDDKTMREKNIKMYMDAFHEAQRNLILEKRREREKIEVQRSDKKELLSYIYEEAMSNMGYPDNDPYHKTRTKGKYAFYVSNNLMSIEVRSTRIIRLFRDETEAFEHQMSMHFVYDKKNNKSMRIMHISSDAEKAYQLMYDEFKTKYNALPPHYKTILHEVCKRSEEKIILDKFFDEHVVKLDRACCMRQHKIEKTQLEQVFKMWYVNNYGSGSAEKQPKMADIFNYMDMRCRKNVNNSWIGYRLRFNENSE